MKAIILALLMGGMLSGCANLLALNAALVTADLVMCKR